MFPKLPPPPSPPAYLIFWKKISSVGRRPLDGSVNVLSTEFHLHFRSTHFFCFLFLFCRVAICFDAAAGSESASFQSSIRKTNNFRFLFLFFVRSRQKWKVVKRRSLVMSPPHGRVETSAWTTKEIGRRLHLRRRRPSRSPLTAAPITTSPGATTPIRSGYTFWMSCAGTSSSAKSNWIAYGKTH